jgi:AraC-like DNA-binding protein
MAASVARALYDEVGRVAAGMGYRVTAPASDDLWARSRRVPLRALADRLSDLEAQSGDPHVGLRVGRLLGPVAVGIPGYLAMAGPTLLDALPRLMGYQRLVADGVSLRFSEEGDEVRLRLAWEPSARSPALSDLLLAALRFFGVWLLGKQPPIIDVWFHYPPPADTSLHGELFGVAPRFDAPDDGFALARAWFSEPLPTAAASLVPALEAQAVRLLAAGREDDALSLVGEAIVDLIAAGGAVGVVEVAARLHSTPRTLQRRLAAHGTTFNRLLQEVRTDLANRYLADERLSLIEIAGLLGYREQSSFCHAYRQWTGRTPSRAREAFVAAKASVKGGPAARA